MVILGILAVWLCAAMGLAWYGRRAAPVERPWDAIVVLGCRVTETGRPSVALRVRVERAVELQREGFAPTVIFTGGVGDAGYSEAAVAAQTARELGLPASAIVMERASTSTEENARFAAATSRASRVLLVTDAYHVFRAERVFGRYFAQVRGVGTVNPYVWPRVRGALREVAAIASYGLRGRL